MMHRLSTHLLSRMRTSFLARRRPSVLSGFLLFFVTMLATHTKLLAQINMYAGTATTCSSAFYDSGGPSASYSNNEDYTLTIYPSTAGGKVIYKFTSFNAESCCDWLKIYNGNSTAAPLIGTYTGTTLPPTFTSTAGDGSITFQFHSDVSVVGDWVATLSCYIPPACTGTVTAGTAIASSTSPCPGKPVTFSLSGSTGATGITYQWDTSTTGAAGTFVPYAGATTFAWDYTPPAGRTLYYRCRITCTASGSSSTSTTVSVTVPTVAAPPYTETFEGATVGVNIPCASYTGTWGDGSYWYIRNSSYGSAVNHTPGGSKYLLAGWNLYTSDFFWFSPGLQLQTGKTYRFSYWYINDGYAYYNPGTGAFVGTDQTAAAMTPIGPYIYSTSTSYNQYITDFTVPSNAVYFIGIKTKSTGNWGWGFDDLNLIELPPCNTATSSTFGKGGKAMASPNVMCSIPATTNLVVTGTPPFSGLSFSWEMSSGAPTFVSPTVVGSAASSSYTVTAPGTYYFRCKVMCAATGLTTYSDTVKVTTTPITPPYVEDFESATPGTNLPCAGSTYWGSIPSYWNIAGAPYDATYAPGIRNHTTGGSKYLHAGYYLGYGTSSPHYWFTPGLALTAGKAYNVSYWYSNSGYYPSSYATYETEMGVYAGTAQTAAAMTIRAGTDTSIYIDAIGTATYDKFVRGFIAPTTGTYFVGIKVNHKNYCYYGFAIDDMGVDQLPPCSAKPAAGTAVASPSLICTSGSSTVSLVGISLASDLSFQWQSSTTGLPGSYTDVAGAISPAYTTPVLSSGPMYYRCVVKCGLISAPNTDTSAPAKISVGAIDLPYVEDFETGVDGVNMPCAGVAGTWSSSIQYWWLRSGLYSTSYPGVTNHTPGGKKYIFSGYYNGPYYSSGDQFYWFTPALKMTAGKGYEVGFWFNGAGYATGTNGLKVGIYAGTAQSATGMTIRAGGVDSVVDGTMNSYTRMVRGFVAPTTGSYYVGIKTVHTGYNYPGIPLDDINVNVLPDCSGKPTAGVPDATPAIICTSGTTILRLSGTSIASGITYKWLECTTGPTGTYTASSTGTGFNSGNYTTGTLSAPRWYKCVVTCSFSGQSDTSSVVAVNAGGITPPYREDFEKVIPGSNAVCAANSYTWGTSSSTNYWTTKGFDYTGYAVVHRNHTPGGSIYLWAGYYLGYASGSSGGATWFTPAIKLVKDSTYEFSFWYVGPAYYYYHSAAEMGMAYGTAQTEAAMTNIIRPNYVDKRGTYKQLIGRFKSVGTGNYYMGIKVKHTYSAYSYYGTAIDDIALDMLSPCTGTPTAGLIFATPDQLCSAGTVALDMNYSNVSKASGLTYRWESSTSGPTSGFTTLSSTLNAPNFTTPSLTTTTWFRCVVTCTNTGLFTTSDPIKVDVGVVKPPYFQSFEGVNQGSNAPCASVTNTFSASSTSYWGVYRVPMPSTSYAPYIDNHTPDGTAYLFAGTYLGAYSSGKDEYWFTPGIALTGGNLYYFSFWYRGSGYSGGKTNVAAAYGTSNTAAAMTSIIGTPLVDVNATSYKKYGGTFTPASSGTYYMGIRINHKVYSYPGIVIDDIGLQEVPPCSAPVVAGKIVSEPEHICSIGGTALLDLEGVTLAKGLTYEWQSASSPTGPFFPTSGTTVPYTTDPLTGPTWFKCIVRCPASGAVDSTPIFKMGVGGKDLPYIEDFESTPPGTKPLCSDATAWGMYYYDAWNVYAGTYTGSYTNHTPGGNKHLIGGYYLGWSTYSPTYTTVTDDNYWFTPGLNMRSGYKYNLVFWYLAAYSSYPPGNRMGVFFGKSQSPAAMTNVITPFVLRMNTSYVKFDTNFTVPSSGTYYLGFKKSNNTALGMTYCPYGVAFDDINLNYAPCDGMPASGSIFSSVSSGTAKCVGTKMTLTDIGATISLVPGIKYQWQRRPLPGTGSWMPIAGAVDTILTADTLIGYEYRLAVVCGNTNDTSFTSPFALPALPAHPPVSITPSTSPVMYCLGDTVKFNATNYASAGAVYDWMLDSVVVPGWKFSDMGATDPGTYMVRVTSALSPCPGWSNKVKLMVNDPGYTVTITKPADSIICAGTSMVLTAVASKPGVTFQWRKDNVDIPGATGSTFVVTTGGYYRVMASDGVSSCAAASRNINIIVKPNPPAVITVPGGTLTACENDGVRLDANTGGYSYEWTRGGSTVVGWTDSSVIIRSSGVYAVKVRSSDGCVSVSSSVTVTILPSPTPVIVRTGDRLTTTTSYVNYQWIRNGVDIPGPKGTDWFYDITLKGVYKVRVAGTNNCTGESTPIEAMEDYLGVNNVTAIGSQIRIYPNPTQSKVYIESPVKVRVKVKDVSGRTVYEDQVTKEVDLSRYADGVYLFIVSDELGNELIKQQRVTKVSAK